VSDPAGSAVWSLTSDTPSIVIHRHPSLYQLGHIECRAGSDRSSIRYCTNSTKHTVDNPIMRHESKPPFTPRLVLHTTSHCRQFNQLRPLPLIDALSCRLQMDRGKSLVLLPRQVVARLDEPPQQRRLELGNDWRVSRFLGKVVRLEQMRRNVAVIQLSRFVQAVNVCPVFVSDRDLMSAVDQGLMHLAHSPADHHRLLVLQAGFLVIREFGVLPSVAANQVEWAQNLASRSGSSRSRKPPSE